jgi:hypothetical protein
MKGAIVSFQTWVKRLENIRKTNLVKKLCSLKAHVVKNFDEITKTEIELNNIIDVEVLQKVKTFKLFLNVLTMKNLPRCS